VTALAEELLQIARRRVGLAASAYVTAELRAVGRGRADLDAETLRTIARRARMSGVKFMDEDTAQAFAQDIEALADRAKECVAAGDVVEHRLALNAAESLLARGDTHRALAAYRELAATHGDLTSYRGVARAALALGKPQEAMEALRDAALCLVQNGHRDQAISLLEEAVRLVPTDLAVHRRLVALYANAGDITSSKFEHSRFVEACLTGGDVERARAEILYARETVGTSLALQDLERRAERRARPAPVTAPSVEAPRERPKLVVMRGRTAEERALALMGEGDPAAADATLAAARELLAGGKPRSASDLLLAHVGCGLASREVQALLVDVQRAVGRPDLAVEKCGLLARVLELDGDQTGAARMKRLALAS
jgi:tetratricopeptide (TPR) repeat protein